MGGVKERSAYRILDGKPERKTPLGRPILWIGTRGEVL